MAGNRNEKRNLLNLYRMQVDDMIQKGKAKEVLPFLQENMEIIKYDNDLMTIWYLGLIAGKEDKAGVKNLFEKETSLETLLERCLRLKFFLRRIEFDVLHESNEFYSFLAMYNISEYELMGIVDSSVYNKEKVWKF